VQDDRTDDGRARDGGVRVAEESRDVEAADAPVAERSVVVARLRSGRALLAFAVPVGLALLLTVGWEVLHLLRAGAVVRDGELAAESVTTSAPLVQAIASLVLVEVAALWATGAALCVLALEAAGLPVRWREVAVWPLRYRRAAFRLGGVGLLVQVAAAAAFALVSAAALRADLPGGPVTVLAVATTAAVGAVAAFARPLRRAALSLVLGDPAHPGVIDAPRTWWFDRRLGGFLLLWGMVVGGVSVLLTWQRSALGWPVWVASALLLVLAAAVLLVALVLVVDDAARGLAPVARGSRPRARTLRWAGGTAALLAPLLVPALVFAINPTGLVRYQQLDTGLLFDVPVASAGGDTLLLQDDGGWWDAKTALCRGSRCVDVGAPFGRSGSALTEDGTQVWVAAWDQDEYSGVGERALTLTAYPVDDLAHVAVSDDAAMTELDGDWLGFPSADPIAEPVVVVEAGEGLDTEETVSFDRTPVAVAERDGLVVVAASYTLEYRGDTGPMFLARCTDGGCELTQTTHTLSPAAQDTVLDVAIGPDGTAYATAYGSGPDPEVPGGLTLFVQTPSGELITRQIDPGTDAASYVDLAGADVVVADDGTVWLLLRQTGDDIARLMRCEDTTCASWETTELDGVFQGMGTLAVDSTGRPMVATPDADRREVALLSCTDDACHDVERRVLSADAGWRPIGLVLRGDRPVVVVHDPAGTAGGTRAMVCTDARCGAR
jgi:hypothetical protein